MSGGRPGINQRPFARPFVDEFVEQQARNHVERLEDALALEGHGREGRHLHLAVVEQEIQILDRRGIGQVALVVLQDVRDFGEIEFERLRLSSRF
jgi:hypothetical protein